MGNIWKFPYMLGQNGGGAFLLVYICCVLVFGLPLIMTEFMIGKRSGKSVRNAYSTLIGNNRWNWLPYLIFGLVVLVTGFYCVVTGWCLDFLYQAIVGSTFTMHTSNGWISSMWSVVAFILTGAILWSGVGKGIERLSKVLMPLLLFLLLLLIVRVLMLDGSTAGVRFLFASDLSKITPQTVLAAMGQCFYSLSIGMGTLITYGAYMPKNQNVTLTAIQIVSIDTIIAVLAGCAIFPAVFALGMSPAEGPALVFSVLPAVFAQMAGGRIVAILFFALLGIAAITSSVSLVEMLTAFLLDADSNRPTQRLNRHSAVCIASACCIVVSVLCAWSLTGRINGLTIGGKSVFDLVDMVTSQWLLPLSAIGTAIFYGWFMDKQTVTAEILRYHGTRSWFPSVYLFLVRWLIPVIILMVFLNGIGWI